MAGIQSSVEESTIRQCYGLLTDCNEDDVVAAGKNTGCRKGMGLRARGLLLSREVPYIDAILESLDRDYHVETKKKSDYDTRSYNICQSSIPYKAPAISIFAPSWQGTNKSYLLLFLQQSSGPFSFVILSMASYFISGPSTSDELVRSPTYISRIKRQLFSSSSSITTYSYISLICISGMSHSKPNIPSNFWSHKTQTRQSASWYGNMDAC